MFLPQRPYRHQFPPTKGLQKNGICLGAILSPVLCFHPALKKGVELRKKPVDDSLAPNSLE
jgi:hypothetical protein